MPRQGTRQIVSAADGRQLAAAGGEEGPLDIVVPFDGIEDADRPLCFDKAVAERADQLLISGERPAPQIRRVAIVLNMDSQRGR
jgi:hypothetical protein